MILLAFILCGGLLFWVMLGLSPAPPTDLPNSAAKPVSGGLGGGLPVLLGSLNPLPVQTAPLTCPSCGGPSSITGTRCYNCLAQQIYGQMAAHVVSSYGPNSVALQAQYQAAQIQYQQALAQQNSLGNLYGGGIRPGMIGGVAVNTQVAAQAQISPPKDPNLAASDLMEDFIKYLDKRGVTEKQARELPVDIFLAYIVLSATKAEGGPSERETTKIDEAIKAIRAL